jgi:uncharacterized protein YoxC
LAVRRIAPKGNRCSRLLCIEKTAREDARHMDQELLTYLKEQFHEIQQQIGGLSGETRERFEKVEARIESLREESQEGIRHTHVLLEDVQGNVRLVAEGVASVDERMGRLESDLNRKLEELWNLVVVPVRGFGERVTRLEEVENRRHRDIMEVIRERYGSRRDT